MLTVVKVLTVKVDIEHYANNKSTNSSKGVNYANNKSANSKVDIEHYANNKSANSSKGVNSESRYRTLR